MKESQVPEPPEEGAMAEMVAPAPLCGAGEHSMSMRRRC